MIGDLPRSRSTRSLRSYGVSEKTKLLHQMKALLVPFGEGRNCWKIQSVVGHQDLDVVLHPNVAEASWAIGTIAMRGHHKTAAK